MSMLTKLEGKLINERRTLAAIENPDTRGFGEWVDAAYVEQIDDAPA
jgi:hypothetical protein